MTFSLTIQPEAEADLTEAHDWYENLRIGLGQEFIEAVDAVFLRIQKNPRLHPITFKELRQALVRRFPYVVCYVIDENCVDVVAVYHGQRDPTNWQSRLDDNDGEAESG